MTITDSRRFVGLKFGITISASDFSDDLLSSPEDYVNKLTFQESSHVLREGGQLILGHKWKLGGVMHHLASKARDLRMWRTPRSDESNEPAAIINVIAWPDQPPSREDSSVNRLMEQGVLDVRQVGVEGVDLTSVQPKTDFAMFCRTRALTAMRKQITNLADVRICLGGSTNKPERRLSGVMEEALVTLQAEKPLYLSSAIGGVSRLIADAILRRRISVQDKSHFATPERARAILEMHSHSHPYPLEEGPSIVNENPSSVWNALEYLRSLDVTRLAEIAHLTIDEYLSLLTTADLNRALTMFTMGATRIQDARRVIHGHIQPLVD